MDSTALTKLATAFEQVAKVCREAAATERAAKDAEYDYSISKALTSKQVREAVRLRYDEQWTMRSIADRFGVHENTMYNIFRRLEET